MNIAARDIVGSPTERALADLAHASLENEAPRLWNESSSNQELHHCFKVIEARTQYEVLLLDDDETIDGIVDRAYREQAEIIELVSANSVDSLEELRAVILLARAVIERDDGAGGDLAEELNGLLRAANLGITDLWHRLSGAKEGPAALETITEVLGLPVREDRASGNA